MMMFDVFRALSVVSGPRVGVNPVRSVKMVSRRKILSRSRDDLNLEDDYTKPDKTAHFQDDTWYSQEKLYKVSPECILMSITRSIICNHELLIMGSYLHTLPTIFVSRIMLRKY